MTYLWHHLKNLFIGSFIRDVSKLSLGTLIGRIIALAALPLLTRIYNPEDFTLLATYLAIVSTISVAACLRFEIAIPLAENNNDARNLFVLALLALSTVTGLVVIIVGCMPDQIVKLINQPGIVPYLWMIPLGMAAVGIYSVAQNWATRQRLFSKISHTRITQALIGVGTALGLGSVGYTPLGLLLGNILNSSAGGLSLAFWFWRTKSLKFNNITLSDLKCVFRKYKRFPKYSVIESLFNTAGIHVPIILIATHGGEEGGFLMLAIQTIAAPTALLGGAISQVYASRVRKELKEGNLQIFTKKLLKHIFRIVVFPFVLLAILAPFGAPFVFGENWTRVGMIITWITPWMLLQVMASPVSISLHTTGNQAYAMLLQAFGLTLRTGVLLLAIYLDVNHLVEIFSVSSAIFYAAYLAVILKVVSK